MLTAPPVRDDNEIVNLTLEPPFHGVHGEWKCGDSVRLKYRGRKYRFRSVKSVERCAQRWPIFPLLYHATKLFLAA